MSEIKTKYKLGYVKRDDLDALEDDDTAYVFGDYFDESSFAISMALEQFRTITSRDISLLSEGQLHIIPNISFLLQNGLPFYMALGTTTDGADGEVKTHAVRGITTSDELPRYTIHYESEDRASTSTIYKDFVYCKCQNLRITGQKFKNIRADMVFVAIDVVDSVKLTADPALPATAVDKSFNFGGSSYDWNSDTLNPLVGFILDIKTTITPVYVDRTTGKELPKYLIEEDRFITFSLTLHLTNADMLDEIKDQIARTFTITLQRIGADDKITIILKNSRIMEAPLRMPVVNNANIYVISGLAETIEVDVRDSIEKYEPDEE